MDYSDAMFPGFTLDASRIIKMNMMPKISGVLPELYQTTFGYMINTAMPTVADYEGDEIIITVKDSANYFLGVYAQQANTFAINGMDVI